MNRRMLPARRMTVTVTLKWLGRRFEVSLGRFPDGRPAEVFISATKPSSDLGVLASDAALLMSLALQFGVPLDVIRHAIAREESGAPQSIVGIVADAFTQEVMA